jgi:Domain of unknown function (DUF4215)
VNFTTKIFNKLIVILILFNFLSCDEKTKYISPVCGNEKTEINEQCDDGNTVSGDGCSEFCKIELTEICDNNHDDNNDGLIDCLDPLCYGSDFCEGEICGNGLDDDDDNLIDCEDSDCSDYFDCETSEDCTNGIDDDNDGDTDCDDNTCNSHPLCGACDPSILLTGVTPVSIHEYIPVESISKTIDCSTEALNYWVFRFQVSEAVSLIVDSTNLNSGYSFILNKEEEPDITCGLDNISCFNNVTQSSTQLYYSPLLTPGFYRFSITGFSEGLKFNFGEPVLEICYNQMDDDGDGLVDCEDSECDNYPACILENCSNGVDDNDNNLIDCEDPQCVIVCAPPEVCGNSVDDDLDGRKDCEDFDCIGDASCTGSSCIMNSYLGELTRGSFVKTQFDTTLSINHFSLSCGGNGPDYVIGFDLTSHSHLIIHGTQTGSHSFALATQGGENSICTDGELFCKESQGIYLPFSAWFTDLPPGKYYLIMDAPTKDSSGSGEIEFQVVGIDSEICINGVDDDDDGFSDCDDLNCKNLSVCTGELECHDDMDNDEDGWADCSDPDCMGDSQCAEGNCIPSRNLGTLSVNTPLSVVSDLSTGDIPSFLPCGDGTDIDSLVYSFYLQNEGRVRIRILPQGFSEPVVSLGAPGGEQTHCDDSIFMCINVPAPGLSTNVITTLPFPAGGPYYILVSPYYEGFGGTAQIILYLEE